MGVVDIAKELIKFKTENPPGNELACAKFIKDLLEKSGIESEVQPFVGERGNAIGRIGPSSPGLLLEGHIDVVSAGDLSLWNTDPFVGVVKDGRLYGRGSADMKGACACMVQAALNLRGEKFRRRLTLAFTAGEEVDFLGAFALVDSGKVSDSASTYAIVGEPTLMKVVIGHKMGTRVRVTFFGKSSHGSKPELGINAIEKATRFISSLDEVRDALARNKHPFLDKGTVSVNIINGGVKSNVVPETCTVVMDCRRVPGQSTDYLLGLLNNLISKLKAEDRDFSCKVELAEPSRKYYSLPFLEIGSDHEFVRSLTKLGADIGYVPYGTEAPVYASVGIPSVVFGPGSIDQAHTANEFIDISELEKGVGLYERAIRAHCL